MGRKNFFQPYNPPYPQGQGDLGCQVALQPTGKPGGCSQRRSLVWTSKVRNASKRFVLIDILRRTDDGRVASYDLITDKGHMTTRHRRYLCPLHKDRDPNIQKTDTANDATE